VQTTQDGATIGSRLCGHGISSTSTAHIQLGRSEFALRVRRNCSRDIGDHGTSVWTCSPIDFSLSEGACKRDISQSRALFVRRFYARFIEKQIKRGCVPISGDHASKLGAGRINAYRSLTQWGPIAVNNVTNDTTWTNSVYVSADIWIGAGHTLTIEPGTTVYFAPDDNQEHFRRHYENSVPYLGHSERQRNGAASDYLQVHGRGAPAGRLGRNIFQGESSPAR